MGEHSEQSSLSPARMHDNFDLELSVLLKPMASATSDAKPQAATVQDVCCLQTHGASVYGCIEKVFNKDSAKRPRTKSPDEAAPRLAKLSKQDMIGHGFNGVTPDWWRTLSCWIRSMRIGSKRQCSL